MALVLVTSSWIQPIRRSQQVLTDEPGETGLDGRDGLVEVVAVEAHAGLEAERVTGTKTNEHDVGVGHDLLGHANGRRRGNGDLTLAKVNEEGLRHCWL